MCFDVHPKHPVAKIAKKDIVCYKILKRDLSPYYQAKEKSYKLGVLNDNITLRTIRLGLAIFEDTPPMVEEGYHSYSAKVRPSRIFKLDVLDGLKEDKLPIVASCIIPKGQLYYFNPDAHTYVSTNIIIKEIIKS